MDIFATVSRSMSTGGESGWQRILMNRGLPLIILFWNKKPVLFDILNAALSVFEHV